MIIIKYISMYIFRFNHLFIGIHSKRNEFNIANKLIN